MITELSVDYYFSRDGRPGEWEELWSEGEPVYAALMNLAGYLDALITGRVIQGEVHPSAVIGERVIIGEGTVISAGVVIEGPCIIGSGVKVRHGAYIRHNCLIGDNCVVGHATEIKHTIMLPGSAAPHFNYVGDSILGCNVNLGAGVKLANVRNDKDVVKVTLGAEKTSTGLKKLGAVIGDGSRLGCNVVTNPGCLLGPGCLVHPLVLVSGFHPAGEVLARPTK